MKTKIKKTKLKRLSVLHCTLPDKPLLLNINSPGSPRPLARPTAVSFEKWSKIKSTEKYIWNQTFWQNYPQWVLTLEWLVICTEKKSEKLAHLRLLFRKPYRWEHRVWCERHAILMQHNWAKSFLKTPFNIPTTS